MAKSHQRTSGLSKEELIKLITKNSAHLLPLLKQNISLLPIDSLNQLQEISGIEEVAKKMCGSYANGLSKHLVTAFDILKTGLNELGLSSKDQETVESIYKQTILGSVTKASKALSEPSKTGKKLLYSTILSEQTVDVLEGVLNFKKSIDSIYPGLSDKIIAAAIPAITALVSVYAPQIGFLLKTTGILSKAASLIKTDNLEKTVGKMRSNLDEFRETKHLAEAEKLGTKLSELSETIGIPVEALQKAGITLINIEEVQKEITTHPEAMDFLKEVCKFAEKHILDSAPKIEKLFDNIMKSALKDLESKGAPKELIAEFKKMYKDSSIGAIVKMEESLKQKLPAFDKITALQKSADIMEQAQEKITKTLSKKHPKAAKAISSATNLVVNNVKKFVRGDLKAIATRMTKNTKAKNLAKKYLGAGLASEITIKKSQANEASRGRD